MTVVAGAGTWLAGPALQGRRGAAAALGRGPRVAQCRRDRVARTFPRAHPSL